MQSLCRLYKQQAHCCNASHRPPQYAAYTGPAVVAVLAGSVTYALLRRAWAAHDARVRTSDALISSMVVIMMLQWWWWCTLGGGGRFIGIVPKCQLTHYAPTLDHYAPPPPQDESNRTTSGRVVLTGVGEDPTELLQHPLFDRIFDLFDRDANGTIDFREASLGLKKIKPGLPLADARDSALDVFLLYDDDHNRSLDRFEFARFVARFACLAGTSFEQLGPRLVSLLEAEDVLGSVDVQELALLDAQPDMQVWGESVEGVGGSFVLVLCLHTVYAECISS